MTVQAEDRAALQLALVPGVGPRTRRKLLECFGTPQAVLHATQRQLHNVPGVGAVLSARILEAAQSTDVDEVLEVCAKHAIRILLDDDTHYPTLLREIADPPGVLFAAGDLSESDQRSVAIVGTRHATPYGLRQSQRLATELVQAGFTVVSGLARGIDAAAHRGALAAGGRTIAVLGGGLLRLYPPEHAELAYEIQQHGAVLSEAHPLRPPSSGNFPQRNRVITGLSLGVVVIEAGARSGALISAHHALEQGREVFAVPGSIECPVARGCHQLLREGAKLVESIDDIVEELTMLSERVRESRGELFASAPPAELNDRQWAIWQNLGDTPTPIDDLIIATGLPTSQVLATLSTLEVRRIIRRVSGAFVERLANEAVLKNQ